MKILVDTDEWFPVYRIVEYDESWCNELEITEEEYAFIITAEQNFEDAQRILKRGQYED